MTEFIQAQINLRWPIVLPDHRVIFHALRPCWEAERLESMAEKLEPGMVVYDIGAEEGDFTALYRGWVGPSGEVVPVEASPGYWPSIRGTWEANGFAPPETTYAGFASDATEPHSDGGLNHGWPQASEGEIVPDIGFRHLAQQAESNAQITLTDLAARASAPDALMLDIEGAEYRVMEGAADLLADRRPLVWISVHPPTMLEWYGKTTEDLNALMASFGYSAQLLASAHEDFWLYEPPSG